MTDTLTPVERTNWALSTWNSTLDRNDGPTAWLYGQDHQDHLWTTQDLVSSPGLVVWSGPSGPSVDNSGPRVFTWPGCMVRTIRTICGQLRTSCLHLGSFSLLPPHPPHPFPPPTHPPPSNSGLKLEHTFEKIV